MFRANLYRVLPALGGSLLAGLLGACSNDTATTGGDGVGECAARLSKGQLVISEVMPDPAGADDSSFEWFEVHNPSGTALSLQEVGLEYHKVDGSSAKGHLIKDALTIEAGAYMVFGKATDETLPDHIDYGYAADLGSMGNTNGKIRLVCGEVTIDETLYADLKDGYSRSLGPKPPDAVTNDDLGTWCLATTVYSGEEYGTPGAENPDCPLPQPACGECYDGGQIRPVRAPAAGQLVISEVMANASTKTDAEVGEWFELFVTTGEVDLNCLQFGGNTTKFLLDPSKPERTLMAPQCLTVSAGSYSMFAEHVTWSGADFESKITLVDTPSASNPNPGVFVAYGGKILDEVHYTKARDGVAWSLDPDALTAAGNDEPVNWCDAIDSFAGGDLGSPGNANPECPVAARPGTCIDGDGQARDIDYAAPGEVLVTEFLADPKLGDGTLGEWVEIYAGAALDLNGLTLGKTLDSAYATIADIECLPIPAGSYVLLAKSADVAVNGGLPTPDWVNPKIALTNDGSTLVVGVDNQRSMTHDALDEISWSDTADGKSWQFPIDLLPPAVPFDVAINDAPAQWCDAVASFGLGDLGTPQAENLGCDPIPSGDECTDPVTMIPRAVVHPAPGDLLITELHPDPDALIKSGGAGEPTGEWFELYAASAFDLNGLNLGNVFPTKKHTVTSALCIPVDADSYVLLASLGKPLDPPNPDDLGGNGGLPTPDYEYKTLSLSNTGSSLYVAFGEVELDKISNYPKPMPGKALQLGTDSPCITAAPLDTACNDDFTLWCAANALYGLGDLGTPQTENVACGGNMDAMCFDQDLQAMRPLVVPVPGDLVINEFLADPTIVTDANGEWFEVQALNAIDLNDLKILNKANVDIATLAAAKPVLVSADCLHVEAGSYVLFAHKDDPLINGNLPPVDHVVSTTLGNASGGISLGIGDELLHTVGWTVTQKAGKSSQLDPDGVIDPLNINADGPPWCVAADSGTPKQPNPQCP